MVQLLIVKRDYGKIVNFITRDLFFKTILYNLNWKNSHGTIQTDG